MGYIAFDISPFGFPCAKGIHFIFHKASFEFQKVLFQ